MIVSLLREDRSLGCRAGLRRNQPRAIFSGGLLKNTCLRTMECLHCELKAFSDCAYIYA